MFLMIASKCFNNEKHKPCFSEDGDAEVAEDEAEDIVSEMCVCMHSCMYACMHGLRGYVLMWECKCMWMSAGTYYITYITLHYDT